MSPPSPLLASAPAERNGLNAAWPDNPSEADGNSNSTSEATKLLGGENAEGRPRVATMAAAMAIGVSSPASRRLIAPRTLTSCYQVFLAALDTTIVLTAYGAIGSDLHALNQTSWIATACVPLFRQRAFAFLPYAHARAALQLLCSPHLLSATVWEAERYLRPQATGAAQLLRLRRGQPLLRARTEHNSDHPGTGTVYLVQPNFSSPSQRSVMWSFPSQWLCLNDADDML